MHSILGFSSFSILPLNQRKIQRTFVEWCGWFRLLLLLLPLPSIYSFGGIIQHIVYTRSAETTSPKRLKQTGKERTNEKNNRKKIMNERRRRRRKNTEHGFSSVWIGELIACKEQWLLHKLLNWFLLNIKLAEWFVLYSLYSLSSSSSFFLSFLISIFTSILFSLTLFLTIISHIARDIYALLMLQ